jgi:hypothetical protein
MGDEGESQDDQGHDRGEKSGVKIDGTAGFQKCL